MDMKLCDEAVLREIIEQSLAGYWDWDIPSGKEYLSPSFKKMFGYEDHEIENRADAWQKLIFAEDLPGVLETFKRHVESRGAVPYRSEVRYHHKNGSTVWVACTGRMIEWDADGKPLRMVGCHIDITRHKQMEEALQASERRFSGLIRNSFDTVVILDRDGIQRYVSDAAERVHGYSPAELVDIPVIDVMIHPDDQEKVRAAFLQIIETGAGGTQYRHRRKSGGWVYLEARGTNQLDNPDILGVVVNVRDITERRRAEEELQKSQMLYQELVKTSQDLIWQCDARGRYTYLNPAWEKAFGYQIDEMLGRPFADFQSPQQAQRDLELFCRLLKADGFVNGYETVHLRKDGTELHLVFNAKVLYDADGQIAGTRGTAYDITERKRAEESLRRNEAKLRTFVANQPGVAFILDKNGIFTLSEGLGLVKLGLKPGQVIGQSVFDVYQDSPEVCENIRQALSGIVRQFQVTLGKVVFDVWVGPLINADGVIDGVIGISSDITERKHTEEALANIQKLESLGILAGGIAHDFNNLMGGIFGYVDLASEASSEHQVREHLDKVIQTIDRARALTAQLLTFSKGGSPKLEIAPLFPFVQQTAQFALSGSNVSCTFTVADNLWPANFDKNQIGQVVDNLIINAQQAMPLGGTIELSACNFTIANTEHPVLQAGDYVRLAVTDTGIGIPKELQKRIFDPFFTTKARGHGLGLATSYSIIRRHSGSIDVYSEPGKGSTFTVYLPAVSAAAALAADGQKQMHRGSGTFLVMDDESIMLEVITAMLQKIGYTVIGTTTGQEAVAYIAAALSSNNLPVGMLFDLTVPGAMGGKEAIAQIREMGVHIPAFVASGYADDPIMKNPADYGFTASISKPFQRSELAAILEKKMPKPLPVK